MYAVVGYEYHIVCAIFAEGACSAMGVFITKGMNSMKRIISACLEQTNRFETAEEFAAYRASMDRKGIKYKVTESSPQADGSVIAKIKKQYNHYDVGSYLD